MLLPFGRGHLAITQAIKIVIAHGFGYSIQYRACLRVHIRDQRVKLGIAQVVQPCPLFCCGCLL